MAATASKLIFAFRLLAVLVFILAGVNHFLVPQIYESIMPPMLPWPRALVWVSGLFEILGGVGLAVPRTRRVAAWGLIALLVAVFPANVWMVLGPRSSAGHDLPLWLLLARLPLQAVLIAWVGWVGEVVGGRDGSD